MGIELSIDDFDLISERTPLLCDLKPGGQYVAPDLYEAGGVPLVIKRLQEAGLLHEQAIPSPARRWARSPTPRRRPRASAWSGRCDPIKSTGGLAILHGNLAPDGCVVKLAGHERRAQTGPARVFESEEEAMARGHGRRDQCRRCDRDPQRGPGRRAGNARDARGHRGAGRGRDSARRWR